MFDETLNIQTPENITFDYEVAGIGSRFLAAGIDYFIIAVVLSVIYIGLFAIVSATVDFSLDAIEQTLTWIIVLVSLVAFVVNWGYFILFEIMWNGQSPGKRFIHLRVIRTDGTPISPFESVIRNLVRVIDIIPGIYGVGVVTMFINRQSRRLGDLAAGTLVVWEREDDEDLSEPIESNAQESADIKEGVSYLHEMELANMPTERLLPQDFVMAEGYLQRIDELADPTSLGRNILNSLYVRMQVEMPSDLEGYQIEALIREIVQVGQQE